MVLRRRSLLEAKKPRQRSILRASPQTTIPTFILESRILLKSRTNMGYVHFLCQQVYRRRIGGRLVRPSFRGRECVRPKQVTLVTLFSLESKHSLWMHPPTRSWTSCLRRGVVCSWSSSMTATADVGGLKAKKVRTTPCFAHQRPPTPTHAPPTPTHDPPTTHPRPTHDPPTTHQSPTKAHPRPRRYALRHLHVAPCSR